MNRALTFNRRSGDSTRRSQSEIFSLFGTLLIWAYYPSYNSFYAPSNAQQAVAINTYLALLGRYAQSPAERS